MSKKRKILLIIIIGLTLSISGYVCFLLANGTLYVENSKVYGKVLKVSNTNFKLDEDKKIKFDYKILKNDISILSWRIKDNDIASIDSDGYITGYKNGKTSIHIELSNGEKIDIPITISMTNNDNFILKTEYLKVTIGNTEKIDYEVSSEEYKESLKWRTSDSNIVTVDDNGMVSGIGAGTAYVYIYSSNFKLKGQCKIEVVQNELTNITLEEKNINLIVGNSIDIIAKTEPENLVTAITWSSSNTNVATVDSNGKVTAISPGTATITASSNEKSASCSVIVEKVSDDKIILDKVSTTIYINDSITLNAKLNTSTINNKDIKWTSSNTKVAKVSNGKITGIGVGTATITASYNGKKATCKVTVKKEEIVKNEETTQKEEMISISLNKTSLTLIVNASDTLSASLTPTTLSDKTITWSSSNTKVVIVNSNGKVTAISPGTATITASSNGKSAVCSVTVNKAPESQILASSISLNPTNLTINVGSTSNISATIAPSNATNKTITWSSSDTKIATVDNNGKVTGIKAGSAIITATTNNGIKSSASITVKNVEILPTSIYLSKNSISLNSGSSIEVRANVLPTNATLKSISFSSTNSSIASITKTSTSSGTDGNVSYICTIKAHNPGSTIIVATASNGVKEYINVVVEPIYPESINAPSSFTLEVGRNIGFYANVLPSNTDYPDVTCVSSDESILRIMYCNFDISKQATNIGIRGLKAGTTTLILITNNGITKKINVTVT